MSVAVGFHHPRFVPQFHPAYVDKTEISDIEVAPVLGGVEVDWITVLPVPGNLGSQLVSERNGCCVAIPDARFGDNIHDPIQRSQS